MKTVIAVSCGVVSGFLILIIGMGIGIGMEAGYAEENPGQTLMDLLKD